MADYISTNNAEFSLFVGDLELAVTANAATWNIPAAVAAELFDWTNEYQAYFKTIKNKNTRTRQQVIAHDEFRKEFIVWLRPFCQGYVVNNPIIPMADRVALGFSPRGFNSPGPRPAITTAPIPELKPLGGALVQFTFKQADSNARSARHPYSNGITVFMKIVPPGNVAPAAPDPDSNTASKEEESFVPVFNTNARFNRQFELKQVGHTLYVYARWVNTSDPDKDGPYSAMISMVIS